MKQIKLKEGRIVCVRNCMECPHGMTGICEMRMGMGVISPFECPSDCPLEEYVEVKE